MEFGDSGRPQTRDWSPYVFHGGTCVAVHGKDYAVIAGDTRLSSGGYAILTRDSPKVYQLTSKCVVSMVGCQCDCAQLSRLLKLRLDWYRFQHGKEMATKAVVQMLSNILYSRRFFPFYSFCTVAGLDEDGLGVSFGYDAIGSFSEAGATGTGGQLIQPLLDNQLDFKNHTLVPRGGRAEFTLENALSLVRDAFNSAGERDIYTGDGVDIFVVTADGVRKEKVLLKQD